MKVSWLPVKTVGRILNTSTFCQDSYKLFQCFSFLQLMCYKLLITRECVKITWLCLSAEERRQLQNTTLLQIKGTLNMKLVAFLLQHTKAYLMLQIPLCWMLYGVEKRQFFEKDLRETELFKFHPVREENLVWPCVDLTPYLVHQPLE